MHPVHVWGEGIWVVYSRLGNMKLPWWGAAGTGWVLEAVLGLVHDCQNSSKIAMLWYWRLPKAF